MAPEAFEDCIKTPGSEKVTKTLAKGHYVHGCRKPGSKDWVWGEVKTKQKTALTG